MQNKEKTPLIEAIENHPRFWNEAFLERIENLLVERAPGLIAKFSKPGYEPDDCIVKLCCECGQFDPEDVHIPAQHLEMLLGLNPGDIEALQELEIVRDALPTCDCSPWLTLEDVLILLHGHVPKYSEEEDESYVLCYELGLPHGSSAIWEARISHFNRIISLFGDLNAYHIGQFSRYHQKRISCNKAEYFLGLRRFDLELLAESGIIPFEVIETDANNIKDFAVSDLLQLLQDEALHEATQIIHELLEKEEWSSEANPNRLTKP